MESVPGAHHRGRARGGAGRAHRPADRAAGGRRGHARARPPGLGAGGARPDTCELDPSTPRPAHSRPEGAVMAEIVLDGVTKVFGEVIAVNTVSLQVDDGEFMVLVGPSGCGKSTVLRMLAGLEEVTAGEISIGGEQVTDLEPKLRDIAMVFQNYALYPHMTVEANLGFGLKLRH